MPTSIDTFVLPLSGCAFHWRSDGYWRDTDPGTYLDEVAGRYTPIEGDWVQWTGVFHCQGRRYSSFTAKPTWSMYYGELPIGSTAHVILDDGTEPPIVTFHGLWFADWVAINQALTVTVGDDRYEIPWPSRKIRNFNPPDEIDTATD